LGKYDNALKLINSELKVDKRPRNYFFKGLLLEKLNKFDESVKNYEIAIEGFEKLIKNYIMDENVIHLKEECRQAKNRVKQVKILQNEKTSK